MQMETTRKRVLLVSELFSLHTETICDACKHTGEVSCQIQEFALVWKRSQQSRPIPRTRPIMATVPNDIGVSVHFHTILHKLFIYPSHYQSHSLSV